MRKHYACLPKYNWNDFNGCKFLTYQSMTLWGVAHFQERKFTSDSEIFWKWKIIHGMGTTQVVTPPPHPPPPSQTLNPNPDSNPYVITITIRLIEIVIATMCYTREVNSHTLYSVFITGDFIDKKTCRTHAVQATSTRLIGKNKIPPSPQKGKSSIFKK